MTAARSSRSAGTSCVEVLEAESPWEAIRIALKAADIDEKIDQEMQDDYNVPEPEVKQPRVQCGPAGGSQDEHMLHGVEVEPVAPPPPTQTPCLTIHTTTATPLKYAVGSSN